MINIFLLFFTFILWVKGIFMLDPDFGWHNRMGEIIAKTGIPKTDPLSYTMPSFPFVDHEWLTNLAIYKVYMFFGIPTLSFLYAILATAAFFIVIPRSNFPYKYPLLVLSMAVVLPFAGVRPQVESWLFLALLVKVLFEKNLFGHLWFLIPLLFVLWTNLHGGFAVGILALFVWTAFWVLKEKRLTVREVGVLAFSILATFINPYGVRIWEEIIRQATDSSLHWTINEWMPTVFYFDVPTLFLFSISSFLFFRYRAKLAIEKLGVYLLFVAFSISAVRHIPLFAIVTLPILLESTVLLYKEVKKKQKGEQRFFVAQRFFLPLVLAILGVQLFIVGRQALSFTEQSFYPQKAIEFLKSKETEGEIFSWYAWGGYLGWKMPEKKVFIDGRMPSWRWKMQDAKESTWAFGEYQDVILGRKDPAAVFTKYNIQTAILPVFLNPEPDIFAKIESWIKRVMEGSKKEEKEGLAKFLKKEWMKVYADSVAVVYQKQE